MHSNRLAKLSAGVAIGAALIACGCTTSAPPPEATGDNATPLITPPGPTFFSCVCENGDRFQFCSVVLCGFEAEQGLCGLACDAVGSLNQSTSCEDNQAQCAPDAGTPTDAGVTTDAGNPNEGGGKSW
ncbi:hypothetical protein AKJ09_02492 [Labilithrix luteola]|uniref:Lipoprotein n=1 Tax=Labilithrix luteola TaxID=1391654 RepID=A0A0K1PQM7_9BACT|nr:hypothetical protein [Labilithrix luteola]AKU95828.1 hypothetical protein AKJ09_02492 [Labilithrix luteola]